MQATLLIAEHCTCSFLQDLNQAISVLEAGEGLGLGRSLPVISNMQFPCLCKITLTCGGFDEPCPGHSSSTAKRQPCCGRFGVRVRGIKSYQLDGSVGVLNSCSKLNCSKFLRRRRRRRSPFTFYNIRSSLFTNSISECPLHRLSLMRLRTRSCMMQ